MDRSEQAKVGLADEAIVSSGQKDRVNRREIKGSVKIWELDSDNSDVYRGSSVEIDTDESVQSSDCHSLNLIRPCGIRVVSN